MKHFPFLILIISIVAFIGTVVAFGQGDTIAGIQGGFYAMWTLLMYIVLKVVDK